MERATINRREVLKALVGKFGGVETALYFLNDALSDLQTMEVGIADNNSLLAVKSAESLKENLMSLKSLLDNKDYKGSVEKEIQKI